MLSSLQALNGRTEYLSLCERASFEFRRQNYAASAELFRDAVEIDPRDPVAHKGLGAALAFAGRYQSAIDQFSLVCTLRPGEVAGYVNSGGLMNMVGQFAEAILVLRTGLRRVGDHADIYFNLGIAYRHQDQSDMAISCYRDSLKLRPAQPDAHLNLGNIHVRKGDLSRALEHYSQALRIDPEYQQAQIGRMHVNAILIGGDDPGMPKSACGVALAPPPKKPINDGEIQEESQPLPVTRSIKRMGTLTEHLLTCLQHRTRPALLLLGQLDESDDLNDPIAHAATQQLREDCHKLKSIMSQLKMEQQAILQVAGL